jgi:hypothetical protein
LLRNYGYLGGHPAARLATAQKDVHGLPERPEDARHRRVPAVAQLQRAQLQDLVAALVLPARAAALHADAYQRLACGFDGAAADWQAALPRVCLVHEWQTALEVATRIADRALASFVARVVHLGVLQRV